VYKIQF